MDASIALAWALPDEGSAHAERFLGQMTPSTVLWAPALWWYEVGNGLVSAGRRRRLTTQDCDQVVDLLTRLPIHTDTEVGPDLTAMLIGIAERLALSAYDAAYIELAQRRNCGVATLDRGLAAAARRAHVRVWS